LYFVLHIECCSKFKLDLNSNEFAIYKGFKNEKGLYYFLFGLGLKPSDQPSLACTFPLLHAAQLPPRPMASPAAAWVRVPCSRRRRRSAAACCAHATGAHARTVMPSPTLCHVARIRSTHAQGVSMMNFIEIVKNPNEPTLSPIPNPNQIVDQSLIWLENRIGMLFRSC
jgi:hypothetical protein